MTAGKLPELVLPALRGVMGDWVYYSCLMDLRELSLRVHYAKEVHKNKALSDMIQRRLESGRDEIIAEYLRLQPQRFFNSLVIATYDGQPNWYGLSKVRNKGDEDALKDLREETVGSVGFLTLRGDEKLFALDGQHRLAGIKKAIHDGLEQDPYDEVSVIFVAHKGTDVGLARTRRLFTTLNKTAKSVSKADIIALDEDDVMAICVRHLIEETELFGADRIAYVASNNMPGANQASLTTIGNLYDVLAILFTRAKSEIRGNRHDLQRVRPDDSKLDAYFNYAEDYFVQLRKNFMELEEFFSAPDTTDVVNKYRGSHGGKALFRPLGLHIFTTLVARLTKDMSLPEAVELASKLPRDLAEEPFAGLMWDPSKRTVSNVHRTTLREILGYMIGANSSRFTEEVLLERYRLGIGDEKAKLPSRLV